MPPLWDFTNLVTTERRTRLLKLHSFEDAVNPVIFTSIVLAYEPEPFKDARLRGCKRASFLLSVDPHGYDAFFNSPVGYRAQYCLSVEKGKSANRQLMDALKPKLLAFAERLTTAAFPLNNVRASLDAIDAKIWIDETEAAAAISSQLQIEIDYRPWVERAQRADAIQEDEFIEALRGVRAPFGRRLVVKGGWLDDGSEKRDATKSLRSEWIAINGFV